MVNVQDFNSLLPAGDLLEAIFKRQTELILKYHDIEEKIVGHYIPRGDHRLALDIDVPHCQFRLKDFAWRVTEELTEATEALDYGHKEHFEEELVDALHFLVELIIYSGFSASDLAASCGLYTSEGHVDLLEQFFTKAFNYQKASLREMKALAYDVVENLGKAMNCLKNKPWKQTHMLTDKPRYRMFLSMAFEHFITLLKSSGFDQKSTTTLYLNKSEVNKFRIRSQY